MSNKKGVKGFELKISKAQQITLLEVLITAMLVGFAVVFSVWCAKYISFNSEVITAKDEAIANYTQSISATGACAEPKNSKSYTVAELEACTPDNVSTSEVPSSLRSKIMTTMAVNENLESVARDNVPACYDDDDGSLINYQNEYEGATSDEERELYFSMQQVCSALRAIPDALPSTLNSEAALASLTKLFNIAEVDFDNMSLSDETNTASADGSYNTLPITIGLENSDAAIYQILNTIESSIREFDVTSATLEWSASALTLQAHLNAYYSGENDLDEHKVTIKASDEESE